MKIYQFTTSPPARSEWDNEVWYAVTDTGRIVASHVSSSRTWGLLDTGPSGPYAHKYPPVYDLVVLPNGEFPPESVLRAAGFVRHVAEEREEFDG